MRQRRFPQLHQRRVCRLIPADRLPPRVVHPHRHRAGLEPFILRLSAGRDGTLRVLATPDIDTNRYANLWDLDLRLAKDIRITGERRINLAADLFNVMNSNTTLSLGRIVGSSAFGTVNEILSPRILRMTASFKF